MPLARCRLAQMGSCEGVCGLARRLQNSRKPLRAQRNSCNFVQQQWRHRVVFNLRAFLVWPATQLHSAIALRKALRGLTPCTQDALHRKPEATPAPHERAEKAKVGIDLLVRSSTCSTKPYMKLPKSSKLAS